MSMKMIAIGIVAALLSACDSGTPKCNSSEAKSLVVDIAQKEITKQFDQLRNSQMSGMVPKDADTIQLSVINVRTIKYESSLDTYTCSADLEMTLPEKTSSIPITYHIQKTDDNNGQFYINVFGL